MYIYVILHPLKRIINAVLETFQLKFPIDFNRLSSGGKLNLNLNKTFYKIF